MSTVDHIGSDVGASTIYSYTTHRAAHGSPRIVAPTGSISPTSCVSDTPSLAPSVWSLDGGMPPPWGGIDKERERATASTSSAGALQMPGSSRTPTVSEHGDGRQPRAHRVSFESLPSLENLSAGRAGASSPVGAVGAYERVAASGLQYGPAFAVLTSIRRPSDVAGVVAGHLWIDDVGVRRGCFVHPATLDASMQVSAAAYAATASSEQSATRVPAALGAYTIARRSQDTHAWVMARAVSSSDASAISNHWIVDREGGAFANLHQLDARVIGARPTAAGGSQVTQPVTGATCLYEMRWTIAATAGLHESDALLASRGGRVLTTGSAPALAQPRKASGTPIATGVVGISHRLTSADCRVLSASVRMLELAQCASMLRVRRFELVTRGAHAPAAVSAAAGTARTWPGVALASAWGVLRTAAAELPQVQCGGVDVDASAGATALTSATRRAPRLARARCSDRDCYTHRRTRRYVASSSSRCLAVPSRASRRTRSTRWAYPIARTP